MSTVSIPFSSFPFVSSSVVSTGTEENNSTTMGERVLPMLMFGSLRRDAMLLPRALSTPDALAVFKTAPVSSSALVNPLEHMLLENDHFNYDPFVTFATNSIEVTAEHLAPESSFMPPVPIPTLSPPSPPPLSVVVQEITMPLKRKAAVVAVRTLHSIVEKEEEDEEEDVNDNDDEFHANGTDAEDEDDDEDASMDTDLNGDNDDDDDDDAEEEEDYGRKRRKTANKSTRGGSNNNKKKKTVTSSSANKKIARDGSGGGGCGSAKCTHDHSSSSKNKNKGKGRTGRHHCGKSEVDFATYDEWVTYRDRRDRNNAAATKSREQKRQRVNSALEKRSELENENDKLRTRVDELEEQMAFLRRMVLDLGGNPDMRSRPVGR